MTRTTRTIAIVSDKGGAGKTILAVNLAVAAERHGLATAILDCDPRANATVWGDARGTGIPAVVPAQAPRLPRLLGEARNNGTELVIIDTPGNAGDLADAAAAVADAILIPCRPSGPDLVSVAASVARMRATGKPAWVVINAAPVRGPETAEAVTTIEVIFPVAPVVLHHRKAFSRRFHEGLTAPDIEPAGKAAAEIMELLLWVRKKVTKLSDKQVSEISA